MIHWGSLLTVQLVSFVATTTVVALVSLAVVGLSARSPGPAPRRHTPVVPVGSGTAVGTVCLVLAALIVLFGLWEIVA